MGERCQVPRCPGAAVATEPDASDPPRYWRVCDDHLAAIRSPRQRLMPNALTAAESEETP